MKSFDVVSIHASVKDATSARPVLAVLALVSIHASVKDATAHSAGVIICGVFQSTRP